TANVLAAARAAGVSRVLVTGTVMVLGPTDQLVEGSETTSPPDGGLILPYQASKARALELARLARTRTLSVGIVHPGALYGAGPLTDGNYIARVMQQLRDGGFPMLPRMRGERWCLAHVEDVARGHRLALERGDPDGEYILGGDNVTFDRMLEIIR